MKFKLSTVVSIIFGNNSQSLVDVFKICDYVCDRTFTTTTLVQIGLPLTRIEIIKQYPQLSTITLDSANSVSSDISYYYNLSKEDKREIHNFISQTYFNGLSEIDICSPAR